MLIEKIRQAVRAGKSPKQAIAGALSEKRRLKMAQGGFTDSNKFGDQAVVGAGLADESMTEMSELGVDSGIRTLPQLAAASESEADEVANPSEIAEAIARYAMGGLVEAGPEEDERLHGNQPEESMGSPTEEPMSSEPSKSASQSLSEAALKALELKKKSRRYH